MSCTVTCFYCVGQQVFSAWERKITVVMTSKDASRLTEKKLHEDLFRQGWLQRAQCRWSVGGRGGGVGGGGWVAQKLLLWRFCALIVIEFLEISTDCN